jgi:hypothetical protein
MLVRYSNSCSSIVRAPAPRVAYGGLIERRVGRTCRTLYRLVLAVLLPGREPVDYQLPADGLEVALGCFVEIGVDRTLDGIVATDVRREIASLEMSDLGGVPRWEPGGDATAIGLEQRQQPERIADPALRRTVQGEVVGLPDVAAGDRDEGRG